MERNHCVFTKSKELKHIITIKNFPVSMCCTDEPENMDIKHDLSFYISEIGSIQINPVLPLELVYQKQHNESYGKIWKSHHETFSEFILPFINNDVLEIGGANGILFENINMKKKVNWTMIEPNPTTSNKEIKIIKKFLDNNFDYQDSFDLIVHSHLFEHIYEPGDFMMKISEITPVNKYHCFSIPNLQKWIELKYSNALNFEHTIFLTEKFVDFLVRKNGFEILKKDYFGDHSIFYATKRVNFIFNEIIPNFFIENNENISKFFHYFQELIKELNSKLKTETREVYLFGAHIFSQFLLTFGLNSEKIICILDNGPSKIGKRLYGTNFKIFSPKILKNKQATVILKAGSYNDEIKKDILENINNDVKFI